MEEEMSKIDDILNEIDSLSVLNHNSRHGLSHQRVQRWRTLSPAGTELEQIHYLVDSHSPSLREKTAMRYERILRKDELDDATTAHLQFMKNIIATKCPTKIDDNIAEMIRLVAEMPKEWTIVQLTSQYNSAELENIDPKKYETNALHISVFNCGQTLIKPFMVTTKEPKINENKIELVQELVALLSEHRENLMGNSGQKTFKNQNQRRAYYEERQASDQNLKKIVDKMEHLWLKEWRCLLIGKYQDGTIEEAIRNDIDDFISSRAPLINLTQKSKEILYQIMKGARYLRAMDILNAVQYCFGPLCDQAIIKDVSRFIREWHLRINTKYPTILRHPVILVVDEYLDSFPWEMMDVLEGEPVSRVPSLHFIYFLYKAHEKEIENGHKIVTRYNQGSYVVNPDRDLENMETRMVSFYNYWLPEWKGISDRKPENNEFFDLLISADVFSYNGHGSGAHIMSAELLQKTHIRAVVLLFGCGSTRITHLGPQVEMYGTYHMYLISRCPCVVGMLWEVTDVDTDVLTTSFISNWIPSKAAIHWRDVDKSSWKRAIKTENFVADCHSNASYAEPNISELLRALSSSRKAAEFFMTKAACVARGLPVKIRLS